MPCVRRRQRPLRFAREYDQPQHADFGHEIAGIVEVIVLCTMSTCEAQKTCVMCTMTDVLLVSSGPPWRQTILRVRCAYAGPEWMRRQIAKYMYDPKAGPKGAD